MVIGSGAIGIEFASFYLNLGAEVTLVEVMDRILPVEDAEISAFVRKAFEKQGMKILTERQGAGRCARPPTASPPSSRPTARSQEITADRVISAVGIVGNVEDLGLEGTGVKVDRTHVVIDEYCRTGEPGVYAIGDLTGAPWLAHKASHEGVLCVEKIAGVEGVHPLEVAEHPGLHLLPPAGRQRRPDRGGGQGGRARGQGRPLPLHRQRQGHRHGRAGGAGQDHLRRQDRRVAGRPHGRRPR